MTISTFELEILGWLMDDYEAPHTLAVDVSRELRHDVTDADVLGALLSLARAGMANAYFYDPSSQEYIRAESLNEPHKLWFLATEAGRARSSSKQ